MKFNKSILALALGATLGMGSVQAADITIAYAADPVTMDPNEQISTGVLQMSHLVFDSLVRFDNKLNPEARLAKSWEQIDDKTMRFHLREGVKFHSGNTMTADDVIFSYNRISNSVDFKGIFAPYEKMVKIDDYTVDLISKEIYPLALANMSYLFILDQKFYTGLDDQGLPKDRIEKAKNTFAATHQSGTGPFIYTFRQQGVKNVFEKFDGYWGSRGNVDKITLVPIKENATRVSALLSGDVDLINPVPPTDLQRVDESTDNLLYTIPSDRIIMVQMNENVVPQFKDVRVRQAVVHAINNKGIAQKIMRGFATPAGQSSPDVYLGHDPELTPRFDLKKARELMKEAGYEDGFTIDMISPNNRYVNDEKIAQTVASMLAKIKIKVNLTTMPKAQYWPEFDKCAAGLQLIGWSSDTGDSANYSEFLTMTRNSDTGAGQYNCGYYSNSEVDSLIGEANKSVDSTKRAELLQKISDIEYKEAAFIPLHWQNHAWGYSNKLQNFPEIVNLKNFPNFGDLIVKEK